MSMRERVGIVRMVTQVWEFILLHKKTILVGFLVVVLVALYPSLFKAFYESGRDFGKSLVNALVP